jgi:hypothetical protein
MRGSANFRQKSRGNPPLEQCYASVTFLRIARNAEDSLRAAPERKKPAGNAGGSLLCAVIGAAQASAESRFVRREILREAVFL